MKVRILLLALSALLVPPPARPRDPIAPRYPPEWGRRACGDVAPEFTLCRALQRDLDAVLQVWVANGGPGWHELAASRGQVGRSGSWGPVEGFMSEWNIHLPHLHRHGHRFGSEALRPKADGRTVECRIHGAWWHCALTPAERSALPGPGVDLEAVRTRARGRAEPSTWVRTLADRVAIRKAPAPPAPPVGALGTVLVELVNARKAVLRWTSRTPNKVLVRLRKPDGRISIHGGTPPETPRREHSYVLHPWSPGVYLVEVIHQEPGRPPRETVTHRTEFEVPAR